jgi:hypothetical protein
MAPQKFALAPPVVPAKVRRTLQGAALTTVKIFCGNSNRPLATRICESIGIELGKATVSTFPDGETLVKVDENVRGRTCSWCSRRVHRRTRT